MKGLGLGLGLSGDGGGASFTPTTLFTGTTGLWYDASDASTLFQDTAGTTPALVASGHPVGRVNDKSPHGVNATQGTAGARPVLATNAAGKTVIRFDGTDDRLDTTLFLSSGVSTVAFVGQGRVAGYTPFIYVGAYIVINSGADRFGVYAGGFATSASVSGQTRAAFMVRARAANDIDLIANGVSETVAGASFGSATAVIGWDGNFANMDIEEMLVFDRALTNGEVTSLNTYLATKHGL